jgi:asparagine synthase (glutamine-hydrolysing)
VSGIVAVVDRDGAAIDSPLLDRLTGSSWPTAPDVLGSWRDAGIGLGHAPISTPTDSAERQPSSLDGRTWITADARIDGRAELARAVEAKGRHVPASATDEQLLLHAYRVWGDRCVEHLLGDFAFIIWDGEARRLFCARDQFGVRPLYYAIPPGGLVLSNSLQSLRAHPAVSAELDQRAIGDFLLWGKNMDVSATILSDVRLLPPAHTLTWNDGAISVHRYWDLPQEDVHRGRSQDHVERFATVFGQAVGDRVRTDAIGTQLSGGLDSTSITVTAHKAMTSLGRPFDLRAFTVVFEWLIAEEEARYADLVANRIGVPIEYLVAEDYQTRAPDPAPAWVLPEPWGIAECSQDYEMIRRVSQFAPVMLSGLGGDPLLATGYGSAGWRDRTRAEARASLRDRRLPRLGVRTALRSRLRPPPPSPSPSPSLPEWINPAFARRIDLAARREQVETRSRRSSAREQMLSAFWADMFRSAHPSALGLPVQMVFPFFDLRLVQCVLETPPIPWRVDKRLLREAMRGQLPEVVRMRPKTSLYRATEGADERYPLYRLGRRAETRRWREELIRTPAMAEFADVPRALSLIEAPPPAPRILATLEHCLSLAYWLKHQPSADRVTSRTGP